jgi:pyridoxal phosphate enzyme (YggS family)
MDDVKERIAALRARICRAAEACGRRAEEIRLLAVGKTFPAAVIRQAIEAGVADIGENYIQEALGKFEELGAPAVRWHFIGHLQTNKAKAAVKMFDLIHSVDSARLGAEIDRCARRLNKVQPILVQVNVGGEASKSGTSVAEACALVRELAAFENIAIKGFMTIPPYFNAPEQARPFFAALRRLRDRVRREIGAEAGLEELSMGMTGDFEAAIAEGATIVRIGTAIFGDRA